MTELAQNLLLSISREDGQIRITLVDELQMLRIEVCHQITAVEKKTLKSGPYFVREATVIAMRRLIAEAFQAGLISDAPGELKITTSAPTTTVPDPDEDSIDFIL